MVSDQVCPSPISFTVEMNLLLDFVPADFVVSPFVSFNDDTAFVLSLIFIVFISMSDSGIGRIADQYELSFFAASFSILWVILSLISRLFLLLSGILFSDSFSINLESLIISRFDNWSFSRILSICFLVFVTTVSGLFMAVACFPP